MLAFKCHPSTTYSLQKELRQMFKEFNKTFEETFWCQENIVKDFEMAEQDY